MSGKERSFIFDLMAVLRSKTFEATRRWLIFTGQGNETRTWFGRQEWTGYRMGCCGISAGEEEDTITWYPGSVYSLRTSGSLTRGTTSMSCVCRIQYGPPNSVRAWDMFFLPREWSSLYQHRARRTCIAYGPFKRVYTHCLFRWTMEYRILLARL